MNTRPYGVWARSVLSPRDRLLPGIGQRLGRRPRLAAAILVGLRRIPGRTLRGTVYRNVSRPLAQRMDSRLVVSVTGGSRMNVDTSDMLGRVLATSGVWEPQVTAVFQRLLARGDVCVDVGAHAGYYTLLASRLVGPAGRVYALEPSARAHEALRANLALNAVSNVIALLTAAGASEGSVQLSDPPSGNTGEASVRRDDAMSPKLGAGASSTVSVRTVASLLDTADADRVRLVKIDVEGFEAEVLRGLAPLFERGSRPALIVELHPDGASDAVELLAAMSSAYGLTAYELVRNPYRERFAQVPPPREILELHELVELCVSRTVNILLAPGEAPFPTR
ncbi:MAG: FkbM family methyltransferase [Gaiellaceae bacterium]